MSVNKIITFSKCGPIPDVDSMCDDVAIWSWWMPWYESWGGKYVSQTSPPIWKKNMEDNRLLILEKMLGWDIYYDEIFNRAGSNYISSLPIYIVC